MSLVVAKRIIQGVPQYKVRKLPYFKKFDESIHFRGRKLPIAFADTDMGIGRLTVITEWDLIHTDKTEIKMGEIITGEHLDILVDQLRKASHNEVDFESRNDTVITWDEEISFII